MKWRLLGSLATAVLVSATSTASATMFALDATEEGSLNGQNVVSQDYVVGNIIGEERRNYFKFAIPTLDGPVVSATLFVNTTLVQMGGFPDSGLVYSVTSTFFSLVDFQFLGMGTQYALTGFSDPNDTFHNIQIPLNSLALSDIGSGGFTFVLSGRAIGGTTFFGPIEPEQYVFSLAGILFPLSTRALLEIVTDPVVTPLPAALPLFATGLGALGLIGWRRKRKAAALAA
jgi:hypothetical protein